MAHDPREPFTPDEAELARVYAALPRIEPSPALDARVLAHARAAVAPAHKRKPRPWYLMPATGAAAAAVLAAGIGWQVGLFEEASVSERATAPAPAAAAKQEAMQDAAEERKSVDIDYVRKEAARRSAEADAQAQPQPDAKPRRAVPANAPPPAPPAPPPPQLEVQAQRAQEFVPEPPEQEAPPPLVFDEPTPMSTPAPAPAVPKPAEAARSEAAPSADAAAIATESPNAAEPLGAVAGAGRESRTRDAGLPPWRQDAELAPDAWLDRIRERVRLGDRQGAQFSLRKFQLDHPTRAIPPELQRLLVE